MTGAWHAALRPASFIDGHVDGALMLNSKHDERKRSLIRRVLDFLNQPEMFFVLDAGPKIYLVSRRTTSRVYDARSRF
jgi:mevalonate pyrophosphate decarboxylase